jgi:hypothetical protein
MSIDPRERYNDPEEVQRMALAALSAELWSALPGIIQSYNAVAGTVTVLPSIKSKVAQPDGSSVDTQLPLLLDVPVCFMGGGGCVLTLPLAQGDECLVIFADRCIDGWFQLGGVQTQTDQRLHDLSDGFAIVGPRSLARALTTVSTTTAQFRSIDGTTYQEINPATKVINVVAPGGINLIGNTNITGTLTNNGHNVGSTHEHSGVSTGGSNTGPPL